MFDLNSILEQDHADLTEEVKRNQRDEKPRKQRRPEPRRQGTRAAVIARHLQEV